MRTLLLCAAAATIAMSASAGSASIVQVSTSHNISYRQTGVGSLNLEGTFFSADIIKSNDDLNTTGSLSIPGVVTPQPLALVAPNDVGFQTAFLPDQAALDAAYPTGDYGFTLGASTFVSNVPGTLYSAEVPQIANFDVLAALNPHQSFTIDLTGGFVPQGTESFTFFTIFDQTTNALVYDAGFLSPTTTSFTIGANTLTAGHSYRFETIFDNRYSFVDGVDPAAYHLFDTRTFGDFSVAAVPEPASWAMMLGGFGLIGSALRSRRKAHVRFG
jgi:hypothetical protein